MRLLAALTLAAGVGLLGGCFQRKETAVLNPDGSGKMVLETTVAVPSQGLPGEEKPTPLSFGRQVAARLINATMGVDAWADVQVTEADPGHARIVGTAYFHDLNALRFDMPLVFSWKRDADGGGAVLSVQRTRQEMKPNASLSDADLKALVASAQASYKDRQLALQTQLDVFSLTMTFELPGEVTDAKVFVRDGQAVSIALEGKKAMEALNKFMADDAALTATFKAGQDLPANDDILLRSMYGQNGPLSAHVKFAAATRAGAPPAPVFDYRTETRVAEFRQAEMLKDAGIDLIPKFIVNTQPASRPATTRGAAPGTQGGGGR